jgi:hypothetical protein
LAPAGGQLLRQGVQAVPDELSVLVVAECVDAGSGVVQVVAGAVEVEVAEFAVAVSEVEVQGRVQAGDREGYAGLGCPFVLIGISLGARSDRGISTDGIGVMSAEWFAE